MKRMHHNVRLSPRRGISLVEVNICVLLVGMLLIGATRLVGNVFSHSIASVNSQTGALLADQLLAEILQAHYSEPTEAVAFGLEGSESSTTRATWDDVDDYHSLSESPPRKADGSAIPGSAGWTRSAEIALVKVASPEVVTATDEGLKRVTVTVTGPDQQKTIRRSVTGDTGPLTRPSPVDSNWVTGVNFELELSNGVNVQGGVDIANGAEDR